MLSKLAAVCTIALVATSAHAQDNNLRFSAGLSTLGGTVEGAYRFNDRIAVRGLVAGGLTTSNFGINTQTVDGVTYNVNGQLGGFALLADYYTGNSGFRLSGGAFLSNTSFSGSTTASATNPITIGTTTLTSGETASISGSFQRRISPMLSVGYDYTFRNGFTISGELGAIGVGGVNATITAPGAPAADVAREQQNINNELSQFGVYPYIGIMAGIRF